MKKLCDRECKPCKGGTAPLLGEKLKALHDELGSSWEVIDDHHLEKEYEFKDFASALKFTNKVGEMANKVDHHPVIILSWGMVAINLWTHKIDGLSETDFVFAAKSDKLYKD